MVSARTTLRHLKKYQQYLNQFLPGEKSAYFEKLVTEALSKILYLQFYTCDNDDDTVPHRVTWYGGVNSIHCAPPGGPDAIAYCYDYYLIIEITRKTGVRQWTQEFASSIRHCDDFCNQNNIDYNDIYILLICPEIFRDTYLSIKSYIGSHPSYRIILLNVDELVKILNTSILAFTFKQLELLILFNEVTDCINDSQSIGDFYELMDKSINEWQMGVLKREKSVYIGVKSYEAMLKIGNNFIGLSEIFQKLQKHPYVLQYLKIIKERLTINAIKENLIQQSLAYYLGKTIRNNEPIFEPVPYEDFESRSLRLINLVKGIK